MTTDVLQDRVYSLDGAARVLGTSARTLKREIITGKLKAFRIRSTWRITGEDIRCYVARQTVPTKNGGR